MARAEFTSAVVALTQALQAAAQATAIAAATAECFSRLLSVHPGPKPSTVRRRRLRRAAALRAAAAPSALAAASPGGRHRVLLDPPGRLVSHLSATGQGPGAGGEAAAALAIGSTLVTEADSSRSRSWFLQPSVANWLHMRTPCSITPSVVELVDPYGQGRLLEAAARTVDVPDDVIEVASGSAAVEEPTADASHGDLDPLVRFACDLWCGPRWQRIYNIRLSVARSGGGFDGQDSSDEIADNDVECVMCFAGCSRALAIAALCRNHGDKLLACAELGDLMRWDVPDYEDGVG